MKIGDIRLIPISDGTAWWDGGGAFGLVPKTRWEKLLPPDAQNRVPFALRCLLIRAPGATILVDTGMGDKITPEIAEQQGFALERPNGWLADDLARQGVVPEEVDLVVLTHLSLQLKLDGPQARRGKQTPRRYGPRTPAAMAGLTDHLWSVEELLAFPVSQ